MSKKLKFLAMVLLGILLSINQVWGAGTAVYTETYENAAYTASTTYNNSSENTHGPTNYQWGVLCGTPVTASHNGSKAFAMRYYKSVGSTPYLVQKFNVSNVDSIKFWAKTESTNNVLNVYYSTDNGSSWSALATNISITTSYAEYKYPFASRKSSVRLKFTMGTSTEKKSMIIDDISFVQISGSTKTLVFLISPFMSP